MVKSKSGVAQHVVGKAASTETEAEHRVLDNVTDDMEDVAPLHSIANHLRREQLPLHTDDFTLRFNRAVLRSTKEKLRDEMQPRATSSVPWCQGPRRYVRCGRLRRSPTYCGDAAWRHSGQRGHKQLRGCCDAT